MQMLVKKCLCFWKEKNPKIRRIKRKAALLLLYGSLLFVRYYVMLVQSQMLWPDIGQECQLNGRIIWQQSRRFGYEYHLRAETICFNTRPQQKSSLIFQFYSQEKIQLHSQVKVIGQLTLFDMPKNPGEWNQNHHYKGKNIYYRLKKVKIKVLYPGRPNWLDRLRQWVRRQSEQYLPVRERALFLSLFIGDRSGLEQELVDNFRRIGISHILAISGLHIGLLVWLLAGILKKMPLKFPEQYLLTVSILAFYLFFTGGQPSTWRALIMYIILESSYFLEKDREPSKAYFLTLGLLLLLNPFAVYDIGFVMSFVTVGGLIFIYPILFSNCPFYLKLPGITLTAQIVLLPIFSLYFKRFSVIAVLANLWVVPAISGFLVISVGALAVSMISADLAQMIAGAGYYLAESVAWLAETLGQLSWSEVPIRAMSVYGLVGFYAILCLTVIRKQKKYLWLLLLTIIIFIPYSRRPQLAMLDVGQAESMVLEYQNHCLVIDCGLASNRGTSSYLAYRGRERIDMIMLSHLDQDHCGGLNHLLDNFQVDRIGISASYQALTETEAAARGLKNVWQAYRNLLALAEQYQIPVMHWQAGDELHVSDLSLHFLYPSAQELPFASNDFSLVAEMEYGQTQMLLTGDIGQSVEEILIKRHLIGDIEVLKVAHHGSRYSSQTSFLEIVKPELAIISCGRYNKYGHPSLELIKWFQQNQTITKVTAWDGAIFLEFTANGEVIVNE